MQTVVEFGDFHKDALKLLGQEGYEEFIASVALHPKAGAVIAGTGGFRKVRWARPGGGKSGGVRIIYFCETGPIYLYLIYAKNAADSLTKAQKHTLYGIARHLKEIHNGR